MCINPRSHPGYPGHAIVFTAALQCPVVGKRGGKGAPCSSDFCSWEDASKLDTRAAFWMLRFRPHLQHIMCMRAAAAAAKSLQSCPILRDPIDGSPPGSPVPGILQERTLEWVAISFSNA